MSPSWAAVMFAFRNQQQVILEQQLSTASLLNLFYYFYRKG